MQNLHEIFHKFTCNGNECAVGFAEFGINKFLFTIKLISKYRILNAALIFLQKNVDKTVFLKLVSYRRDKCYD